MKTWDKFCDWASMARLPNVPTVWSNVFTAWMLAEGGVIHVLKDGGRTMIPALLPLTLALLGGTLLYIAGTMFCDICDEEFDRQYRPERPIPAQRVSRRIVKLVCSLLMVAGSFALIGASLRIVMLSMNGEWTVYPYGNIDLTMGAAFILMFAILVYGLVHKRSGWLAAILMALCRVLLGLAVMLAAKGMQWEVVPWLMALGLNIVGISWLARGESRKVSGGITGAILLVTLAPLAVAILSHSLKVSENNLWPEIGLWGVAACWLTQPLYKWREGSARGQAVARALAMLPILDALFLVPVCGIKWVFVPLGCTAASLALRRVAAAT